ncbi:probable LRR receptor-like serine/threonine-protein kinase RFK1 [Humulus lupulus]|uniref:probable LRR receptor-like serine/threonine-protein kinase RFK1 n=1 Tax=Humulus lupulus TaxID=3486 RepID=UPI002B408A79|nr:probable LRR receptor-like serine/threonine-protein kinase RFK1 [Humulus lupulus]
MESNLFSGTIPSEIGKLVNLEYLTLAANNFTGEFPDLTSLTKLKELRISSNYFTGRMPEFGNLKQLQKLEVEASGFDGPIPSSISILNKLVELRITDLNGEMSSDFPNLMNMTNIQRLVLRSCNLRRNIPKYIRNLNILEILDLSFNKLEGELPNFVNIRKLRKLRTRVDIDGSCIGFRGPRGPIFGTFVYEEEKKIRFYCSKNKRLISKLEWWFEKKLQVKQESERELAFEFKCKGRLAGSISN